MYLFLQICWMLLLTFFFCRMCTLLNKYVQFKSVNKISFQFYSYAQTNKGSQGTMWNCGVKFNAHHMYITFS
jgi:hypothetical protein